MENLRLSFEIVMPLMLYMLVGVILKRTGLLTAELNDGINKLMFRIFLPILLFKNLYEDDLTGIGAETFVPYAVICTIVGFLLLFLLFTGIEKDPAKRGAMIQGAFRGNSVLFGMPVAISIFGDGNTAEIAIVLAAVIPLYNVLSVIVLEVCGEAAKAGRQETKLSLKDVDLRVIGKGIATNPLIIGVVTGLIGNALSLDFPTYVDKTIDGLSGMVTPMAFVILGASFSMASAKNDRKRLTLVTALKLVINPLIFLILPMTWGWTAQPLAAILVAFGTPTAVSSFPMAKAMNCDGELAGEIVVTTSTFSIFTMFLWIFTLKQMGLL